MSKLAEKAPCIAMFDPPLDCSTGPTIQSVKNKKKTLYKNQGILNNRSI